MPTGNGADQIDVDLVDVVDRAGGALATVIQTLTALAVSGRSVVSSSAGLSAEDWRGTASWLRQIRSATESWRTRRIRRAMKSLSGRPGRPARVDRVRARALRSAGLSWREIARQMNCSVRSARRAALQPTVSNSPDANNGGA
jgi:hypothetical protein